MDPITGMVMDTDRHAALLTLAQWMSPAYPVGAYSYSHGLEWAVECADVADAATFQIWLTDVLMRGGGRNDAILLAAAFNAPQRQDLLEIDTLARALAPSRERAMETCAQGAAFAGITADIWSVPLPDLTYPVAVGAAAKALNLPVQDVLAFYLHGFSANLTSAAIRLVPLGQTEGQTVLAALSPLCLELARNAVTQTLDDLHGCTFLADIASMKHETQYARIFQS
jgi:urease accessory protein